MAPKPTVLILAHRLPELIGEMGAKSPQVMELESIITALKHLPFRQDRAPESVAERNREKEIIKRRLSALVDGSAVIRSFLDENVRLINGSKGDPIVSAQNASQGPESGCGDAVGPQPSADQHPEDAFCRPA